MKLYYSAEGGGHGKASFVTACIVGASVEIEQVDLVTAKTARGADYRKINKRGNAPALVLDDGTLLNEGSAILQALADITPGLLAPMNGTPQRYRVQTFMNYLALEIHSVIKPLLLSEVCGGAIPDAVRQYMLEQLKSRLSYVETEWLKGHKYIHNDQFSIVDVYFWVLANWAPRFGVKLESYPEIRQYLDFISSLPVVRSAEEAWIAVSVREKPDEKVMTYFKESQDDSNGADDSPASASAKKKSGAQRLPGLSKLSLSKPVLGELADPETLLDLFVLGKELGRGQFGTTYVATEKSTGKAFACKSIAKAKLKTPMHNEDVRREVAIMRHLNGCKNIVTLKAAFEDDAAVHLVMDLCTGGELFDNIHQMGHFSEAKAAGVFRIILKVVAHFHRKGVMHRDLKPENFMITENSASATLKAIDFGQSTFFKKGQTFNDPMGSAYYISPEMLAPGGVYGPLADEWAAGVILYVLLCGFPPFYAEDKNEIYKLILAGKLDFTEDPWPSVSAGAKDLIRKLLEKDVSKRLTAELALKHPWLAPGDGE